MFLMSTAGLLMAAAPSSAQAQIKPALVLGEQGWSVQWNGRPGDTYFIQWSEDLVNWSFLKAIYSGDGSAIAHPILDSSKHLFTRLKWTDQADGGDPHSFDFDNDGLRSIDELNHPNQTDPLDGDSDDDLLLDGWELKHGFNPNDGDSDNNGTLDGFDDPDGDGADNLSEQEMDSDPTDAIDEGLPPLEVTGWLPEGEESVATRSYTLPPGSKSYALIAYVHSEEYPYYTSIVSPFDDLLRWDIRPSMGESVSGTVSVNTLHQQWEDSAADGTGQYGYSPAATKILGTIHAHPTIAVSVDLEIGVTNISDGELWSSATIVMVPYEITPDWNRDGIIDLRDRNKVTKNEPWRWWINDDDDNHLTAGAWDGSGDTPTGDWGDSHDSRVDGIRDLVDFFPLHLDLVGLFKHYPPEHYRYVLRHEDRALKYAEVPFANPRGAGGAASHLINVQTAGYLKREDTYRTNGSNALSDELLEAIRNGRGMILCEGSNISDKPLLLEIHTKRGEPHTPIEFPIKISRVEQMYRHANLRDQIVNPMDPEKRGDPGSLPTQTGDPGEYYPDRLTNGQYFVHVHGFANDADMARGGHAEMFKRMHQMGSKARFVGVSWFGDTGADYHHAVRHAFFTGDILAQYLPQDGEIIIAAHSLGNLVVSEAIEYGGLDAKAYYMINAATPIEAYDPVQTTGADGRVMEEFMTETSWRPLRAHRKKLFASDWYRLFAENDGRHKLTWKGRFANKVPQIAINFYSTGEDVVANPGMTESVGEHLKDVILNFDASTHAWVAQEISKGSDLMDIILKDTHAGWHENEDSAPWQAIQEQDNWEQRIDELVSEEFVRQHPFHEPFRQPNLYDAAKGSAEGNSKEVQYRLLATAIPAKSFAVAANPINILRTKDRNFNMMTLKNEHGEWPRGEAAWLHSDFRDVALCYVHKMYDKMINLEQLDDQ